MQSKDKDKHNDHLDDFSKLMQQKLENHRMPVDIGCWNEIESRINPPVPRNRISRKRWVAGIAAVAAFIAIIFLMIPDNKPLSEMAVMHQSSDFAFSAKEYNTETIDEALVNTQASNTSGTQQNMQAHNVLAAIDDNDPIADHENKENNNSNNNPDTNANIDNQTPTGNDNAVVDKEAEKKQDNQKNDTEPAQLKKETKKTEPKIMLPPKANKHDKWLLAASVSSSGNNFASEEDFLSSLKDYSSSPNLSEQPVLADPGNENKEMLVAEDYSNVEHSLPLSFGLNVRKDINKYIGIETGLVYTYLSSTFERVNIPQYKIKQELHYLGIPVNLVVYLMNDEKWNLYLSGGVMLEKGIRQKQRQDMYQSNEKVSSTTDKGSISGVQWSLNASAGVSYAFYEDLSLYVEPRFSHFFDNDQPLSIRTEKSNVFGLGGGLRYKF